MSMATTKPSDKQKLVPSETEQVIKDGPRKKASAVSFLASFHKVKHLLVGRPAPKRPNRDRPLAPDVHLREELSAWDAASDEALENLESE